MDTIIMSARDIDRVVRKVGLDAFMDELIQRLTAAFECYDATECITPTRHGFHYNDARHMGLVEWMPAMQAGERITIKMVGYHPHNPERWQLPTILSTVSVFDVESGHLMGLADATFLTALRTGAASAIASRSLARGHSRVLGLIGAGAQACTQLHAISRLFDLEEVRVFDTDAATTVSFAQRVAHLNLKPTIRPAVLADVVAGVDILCTATSVEPGLGPIFEDQGLNPWLHINAVGADFPGKVEMPLSVLRRAFVCPDFLDQAIQEGECQQLEREEIPAVLVDVVQHPAHYAAHKEALTVFDSTGWALEDQVAMGLLLDYAWEQKLGQRIALEAIAPDPKNPYGFLSPGALGRRPAHHAVPFVLS